jgi:type IV pilus assembly protein PilV
MVITMDTASMSASHPARSPVRSQSGFTIIELLVAVVIAVIGIAGVMGLHLVSSRSTQFSRHATEGAMVAEQKLEQLMLLPTTALTNGTTTEQVDARGAIIANGPYVRTWTITREEFTALVVLGVTWQEDDGYHTVTYRTRIFL